MICKKITRKLIFKTWHYMTISEISGGIQDFPRGVRTYEFAKFSHKLHEIERIWTPVDIPHRPLVDSEQIS